MRDKYAVERELGQTILKLDQITQKQRKMQKEISVLDALAIPIEAKIERLKNELAMIVKNQESAEKLKLKRRYPTAPIS